MKIRLFALAIWIGCVCGISFAQAQSQTPSIPQIRAMLNGVDTLTPAAVWRKLDPHTVERLEMIILDPKTSALLRVRAIHVLRYFSTSQARSILHSVLANARATELELREALSSLAWNSPKTAGVELAKILQHSSSRIRQLAIWAFQQIPNSHIDAVLATHKTQETEPKTASLLARILQSRVVRAQSSYGQ